VEEAGDMWATLMDTLLQDIQALLFLEINPGKIKISRPQDFLF
jgi:hypothetical protein